MTEESRPYVVNVDVAVARDDEYLFIVRGDAEDHAAGELAFPGGTLEADPGAENALERAARREVREEVGLDVGAVEYVTSATFDASGVDCLNVVCRAEYRGGEARRAAPDEVADVRWLTPDEARESAAPYLREYVEAVVAGGD